MLKGVNRNVIEVLDTGNELFERAILFVRAESRGKSEAQLSEGAGSYLSGLRLRRRVLSRPGRSFILLKYGAAAAVGAAAAMMMLRL